MTRDATMQKCLEKIPTSTISAVLHKHGVRNVWMQGPAHKFGSKKRIAGPAFTLRFIAAREDLIALGATKASRTTRAAIEEMPKGCVVVADALGRVNGGIVGDILCARMQYRDVRGLITDGAVRDATGVASLDFNVWSAGIAAPLPGTALHFAGWQEPVTCGGVAVIPGDVIVADDDGAVVIPAALLDVVLPQCMEQEVEEAWVMKEVQRGVSLMGLYPMNEETRRRFVSETGQ